MAALMQHGAEVTSKTLYSAIFGQARVRPEVVPFLAVDAGFTLPENEILATQDPEIRLILQNPCVRLFIRISFLFSKFQHFAILEFEFFIFFQY